MVAAIRRCEGKEYCASESEIDEYIDRHGAMYFVNEQIYNPNEYNKNVIEDSITRINERLDHANPKLTKYTLQENIVDSEH